MGVKARCDKYGIWFEYGKSYRLKFKKNPENEGLLRRAEIVDKLARKLKELHFKGGLIVRGSLAGGKVREESDIDLYLISNFWHKEYSKCEFSTSSEENYVKLDKFLEFIGDNRLTPMLRYALGHMNAYKTTVMKDGFQIGLFVFDKRVFEDAVYLRFRESDLAGYPGDFCRRDNFEEIFQDWVDLNLEHPRGRALSIDIFKKKKGSKYENGIECPTEFGGVKFYPHGENYEVGEEINVRKCCSAQYSDLNALTDLKKGKMLPEHQMKRLSHAMDNILTIKTDQPLYVLRNFPTLSFLEGLVVGKVVYEWREAGIFYPFKIIRPSGIFSRIREEFLYKLIFETADYFVGRLLNKESAPLVTSEVEYPNINNEIKEICENLKEDKKKKFLHELYDIYKMELPHYEKLHLLKKCFHKKGLLIDLVLIGLKKSLYNPQSVSDERVSELKEEIKKFLTV